MFKTKFQASEHSIYIHLYKLGKGPRGNATYLIYIPNFKRLRQEALKKIFEYIPPISMVWP